MSRIFTVDNRGFRAEINVVDGEVSQIKVITSYMVPAVYKNPPQNKISEIITKSDKFIDFENLLNLVEFLKELRNPQLKAELKQKLLQQIDEFEEIVKNA